MWEYAELVALFFLQGVALAMWFVPLSNILAAYGLRSIRPYAFAASAIACFVSPLVFGAMADRHASPVKVLRMLSFATGLAMVIVASAIQWKLNQWIVLGLIQLLSFCSSPSWSIASTVVFARLADSQKQFGPIRAMATIGWMAGCLLVSLLGADSSTLAMYTAALVWLIVGGFTFFLPKMETPKHVKNLTWSERFGLDALTVLKNRDHRVVFIILVLFSIPLAAFYPYAPLHLARLGFERTSAWMSLGQVSEIIAMFSLGFLLAKWRLKWIFCCGLGFGVLRFAFSATNTPGWLLLGVLLHGASYTLVFITAQIYLDQRVDPSWRARAQALMSLMSGGVGNLAGYLGTGWWFNFSIGKAGTNWTVFWSGLSAMVGLVMIYFLVAYRGRGAKLKRDSANAIE